MKIIALLIRRVFSFDKRKNIKIIKDLPKKSILLAEDNPIAVIPIKSLLETQGYHVTAVEDGNKALIYLKSYHYDWALLDIILPEMDALDLVKNYRTWEKNINKSCLPLFGITGYPFKEMKETCKEIGMEIVFQKPFNFDDLKHIERFLNKSDEAEAQ